MGTTASMLAIPTQLVVTLPGKTTSGRPKLGCKVVKYIKNALQKLMQAVLKIKDLMVPHQCVSLTTSKVDVGPHANEVQTIMHRPQAKKGGSVNTNKQAKVWQIGREKTSQELLPPVPPKPPWNPKRLNAAKLSTQGPVKVARHTPWLLT